MTIENKIKDLVSYETSEEMLPKKFKGFNLPVYVKKSEFGLPRNFVAVKDLKPHPYNEEMYPRKLHKQDIEQLKKHLLEHLKENGEANHTAISVCPKTGIVFSGNFRVWAAQLAGIEYLHADFKDDYEKIKKLPKFEQIKLLQKYNLDGKRDESNKVTAVRQFVILNKAHYDKTGKFFNNEEISNFWKVRSIDRADGRKYVKIGKKRKDLLQEIQDNKISLSKAYREFKSSNIKKLPINPNRFDFFKFIEQHPNWRKNLLRRFINLKDHFLDFKYKKEGLLYHPKYGWEPNQISAVFSNTLMSSAAIAFTEEGLDAHTPILEQGAADNRFPKISIPGFEEERIEEKFAGFGGSAAKTKIWGGLGANAINPHEFLIGIHNQDGKKLFLILITLTKDDWKTEGSKCKFNMKGLFERHEHKKDFKVLVGDIYRGNKNKICIDFQSTDELLKEV